MTQTQSSCRQQNKSNFWKTGIIFVASFLSISIIGLWVFAFRTEKLGIAVMGASYAILCSLFLGAQLTAFVRAHMDYDQTIEQPKIDLIRLEEQEWQ